MSSHRKRSRESSGKTPKRSKNGKKSKSSADVEKIKHYNVFYKEAPPGLVKEEEEKPEDCVPDLPENQNVRDFLANAPKKGLWMPLGKEVKVMKCWRCKQYGHRTGDKECPMFISGNTSSEKFRYVHEDPMHDFINESKKTEKESKIRQLQALLEQSTSSDSSSPSSDDDRKKRKREEKRSVSSDDGDRKRKKKSKRKKKRKHKKKE